MKVLFVAVITKMKKKKLNKRDIVKVHCDTCFCE